jgi:hypothetical protein
MMREGFPRLGLLAISVAYLIGSFGAWLAVWLTMRRALPPAPVRNVDRGSLGNVLRRTLGLGVGGLFSEALFRIDTVMLQPIVGPVQVALYSVAYRFFDPMLFVAFGLLMALTWARREAQQNESILFPLRQLGVWSYALWYRQSARRSSVGCRLSLLQCRRTCRPWIAMHCVP